MLCAQRHTDRFGVVSAVFASNTLAVAATGRQSSAWLRITRADRCGDPTAQANDRLFGFCDATLDARKWQDILNHLHLNFPEFFLTQFDAQRFHAAHEMNLLIHWLEYELANAFDNKAQYIFNLDFNHIPEVYNRKQVFPETEFAQFSSALTFSNLHSHYIYIGRHFLEMFDACDLVSPPHHFRAQHEFNATCGLSFSEPRDLLSQDRAMLNYFEQRGGQSYFGFAYDDLKLAKGFFTLGQLENIDDYDDPAQRMALRNQLKDSTIISWRLE